MAGAVFVVLASLYSYKVSDVYSQNILKIVQISASIFLSNIHVFLYIKKSVSVLG